VWYIGIKLLVIFGLEIGLGLQSSGLGLCLEGTGLGLGLGLEGSRPWPRSWPLDYGLDCNTDRDNIKTACIDNKMPRPMTALADNSRCFFSFLLLTIGCLSLGDEIMFYH